MFAKTLVLALLAALAFADMESADSHMSIDAVSNSTGELMSESDMVIEEIIITLIGKPPCDDDNADNETLSGSGWDAFNSTDDSSNSTESSEMMIETITITLVNAASNSKDEEATDSADLKEEAGDDSEYSESRFKRDYQSVAKPAPVRDQPKPVEETSSGYNSLNQEAVARDIPRTRGANVGRYQTSNQGSQGAVEGTLSPKPLNQVAPVADVPRTQVAQPLTAKADYQPVDAPTPVRDQPKPEQAAASNYQSQKPEAPVRDVPRTQDSIERPTQSRLSSGNTDQSAIQGSNQGQTADSRYNQATPSADVPRTQVVAPAVETAVYQPVDAPTVARDEPKPEQAAASNYQSQKPEAPVRDVPRTQGSDYQSVERPTQATNFAEARLSSGNPDQSANQGTIKSQPEQAAGSDYNQVAPVADAPRTQGPQPMIAKADYQPVDAPTPVRDQPKPEQAAASNYQSQKPEAPVRDVPRTQGSIERPTQSRLSSGNTDQSAIQGSNQGQTADSRYNQATPVADAPRSRGAAPTAVTADYQPVEAPTPARDQPKPEQAAGQNYQSQKPEAPLNDAPRATEATNSKYDSLMEGTVEGLVAVDSDVVHSEPRDFNFGQMTEDSIEREAYVAPDFWNSEDNAVVNRLKRDTGNATEEGNSTAVAECKADHVCYSNGECGEGGHCLGLFVGRCNCDACLNFLTCSDDSACGGLKHACNATQSRCNCIEGHKENGFPLFIDALRELCNVKECDASTDTCFGLPCRSGRCVC